MQTWKWQWAARLQFVCSAMVLSYAPLALKRRKRWLWCHQGTHKQLAKMAPRKLHCYRSLLSWLLSTVRPYAMWQVQILSSKSIIYLRNAIRTIRKAIFTDQWAIEGRWLRTFGTLTKFRVAVIFRTDYHHAWSVVSSSSVITTLGTAARRQ